MPRFGTLDVAPIAPDLPDLSAIAGPEWELPDAELLQINWEVDDAAALSLTPPSLHPSIPPFASFFAARFPESPVGPFSIVQVIPGTVIGPSELVKTAEEALKSMDRQTRALLCDDNTPRYAFGFVHVQDCARVHIEALDEEKVKTADVPPWFIAAATTEEGLNGYQVWAKAVAMVERVFWIELKSGMYRVGRERVPTNMPYRVDSRETERMLLGGDKIRGLEDSVREVGRWCARLVGEAFNEVYV